VQLTSYRAAGPAACATYVARTTDWSSSPVSAHYDVQTKQCHAVSGHGLSYGHGLRYLTCPIRSLRAVQQYNGDLHPMCGTFAGHGMCGGHTTSSWMSSKCENSCDGASGAAPSLSAESSCYSSCKGGCYGVCFDLPASRRLQDTGPEGGCLDQCMGACSAYCLGEDPTLVVMR